MPDLGSGALIVERRAMKAYRRAFMLALAQIPAEGNAHMLAALDAHPDMADPYSALAMAVRDVTIFERTHPDMDGFALALGLTPEAVDDIFRLAMQIEAVAA